MTLNELIDDLKNYKRQGYGDCPVYFGDGGNYEVKVVGSSDKIEAEIGAVVRLGIYLNS